MRMSGTSVAAPAVTGAVALMLQANPGLSPQIVKALLRYSAQALGVGPRSWEQVLAEGFGILNVEGAIRMFARSRPRPARRPRARTPTTAS